MNAPLPSFAVQLKDKSLFRQQCYLDGQWVDADSRQTIVVTNPATGAPVGLSKVYSNIAQGMDEFLSSSGMKGLNPVMVTARGISGSCRLTVPNGYSPVKVQSRKRGKPSWPPVT